MSAAPKKDPAAVEAEVREKIHLEILKRTGAYHANDHVLLPSGQHTSEYIEKTLVTTEPSFTEGLGAVIAKHFAQWPVDVVLSTGPGALILSHCVARAHPSRPVVVYGTKGLSGGKRRVSLPVEFHRLLRPGTKVLLVEDLVSTGSTLNLLIELAEQFTEGVSHAFPVLRSVGGEKLAQGEWLQIARGDRVENRLTFRFRDGSLYDERVVFSQKDTFTLVSYQLVQKGPSFPESIDAKVDRETGRYEVRYKGDEEATEEILTGKIELPGD